MIMTPSSSSAARANAARPGSVDGFNAFTVAMTTPFAAAVAVGAYNVRLVSNSVQFWMDAFARSYPARNTVSRRELQVDEVDAAARPTIEAGDSVLPKRPGAASLLKSADDVVATESAGPVELVRAKPRRTVKADRDSVDRPSEPQLFDDTRPAAAEAATAVVVEPATSDDLRAISGIGPKVARVLNAKGVTSFAAIAAWSDADIAAFDDLFGLKGRIVRDDWVGQAAKLLQKKRA